MRAWDDWGDLEINKAVEKITGMYCEDVDGKYVPTCDYCKNWSDMGPIIVENKISVSHDIIRYSASSLVYSKKFDKGFNLFNYNGVIGDMSSRAALRAAAIVLLMMNGVNP